MRLTARRCRGILLLLALIVPAGILVAQAPDPTPLISRLKEAPAVEPEGQGGTSVSFGEAVALLPVNLHEPGIPYSVRVVSAEGEVVIEREGRSILDVRALERHLVVASRGAGPEAVTLAEVIDENGHVAWTFTAPGDVPPRVAVADGRAVAVVPGREESIVEYRAVASPATRRWVVTDAVLTQAALATTGDAVLAWGPRQAIWIDTADGEIAWRAPMTGADRPLASTTSSITPVAGQVGLPVRERQADGAWRVELLLLDIGNGRTASRHLLHLAARMPTAVGRYRRDNGERLVLREHTYEISARPAGTP